jgi:hypothetical protein
MAVGLMGLAVNWSFRCEKEITFNDAAAIKEFILDNGGFYGNGPGKS